MASNLSAECFLPEISNNNYKGRKRDIDRRSKFLHCCPDR